MSVLLALALLLTTASAADAQTRFQQCLATKSCRAEIDKLIDLAVAEAEAAWREALPCERFVSTAAEALPLVLSGQTVCVIVDRVEPCGDGDYCTPKGQP